MVGLAQSPVWTRRFPFGRIGAHVPQDMRVECASMISSLSTPLNALCWRAASRWVLAAGTVRSMWTSVPAVLARTMQLALSHRLLLRSVGGYKQQQRARALRTWWPRPAQARQQRSLHHAPGQLQLSPGIYRTMPPAQAGRLTCWMTRKTA